MLDVGIKETTSTTGTGAVTLSAVAGHVRVSQAFAVGDDVSYMLVSGNGDKEWGVGVAASGNTFTRDSAPETLVGTTHTLAGSPISLTGTSTLIVTDGQSVATGDCGFVKTGIGAQYLCPFASSVGNLGNLALTADRAYFMPFIPSWTADTLDALGLIVTTAVAGSAYVAIYESAKVAGGRVPGKLVYQSAALSVGTTGDKTSTGLGIKLKRGRLYWLAVTCSSAATVRALAVANASCMLGFGTGGTGGRSHIYATQAGPLPADASALTYSFGAVASTPPFIFMVP